MKYLFSIHFLLISLISFTQQIECWTTSINGSDYNAGAISKLDLVNKEQDVFPIESDAANIATPQYGNLIEASNGKLYGMTHQGNGLFEFNPANNQRRPIRIIGTAGANIFGTLTEASNGKLYGLASAGGNGRRGTIFEFNLANNQTIIRFGFNGNNGGEPKGNLIQASNGKLYGMTSAGGAGNKGVVFEFNLQNSNYSYKNLYNPNSSIGNTISLIKGTNDKIYGVTTGDNISAGGTREGSGAIFEIDPISKQRKNLYYFNGLQIENGIRPYSRLIQGAEGVFYGSTFYGGANGNGVIFKYNINNNSYTKITDLSDKMLDGIISDNTLYAISTSGGVNQLGFLFKYNLLNNTFTKLHDFSSIINPERITLGIDGNIYGISKRGGNNDRGVLFSYDVINSTFSIVHSFALTPSSVMQLSDGYIYGNASEEVFKYDLTNNVYTPLYKFPSGVFPVGDLVQVSSSELYGRTNGGGAYAAGTIFKIDISGNSGARLANSNARITNSVFTSVMDLSANTGTGGFGGLILGGGGSILPVVYNSFGVDKNGDDVKLHWSTSQEINSDYFDIESSVDGVNWDNVGRVSGQGNTNELTSYEFVDYGITSKTFYRLKQVDIDGQFEYSKIKSIDMSSNISVNILPTLVDDILTIESNIEGEYKVEILNGTSSVLTQNVEENRKVIDVSTLTSGIYLIRISTSENQITKRFVKL
ncbi:MAG: T9SS type A sorting domain-containing protein [Cytophagales bacterium]|nr:T9SS type A sorting domain-containing protein [Cytophagales bacterium]